MIWILFRVEIQRQTFMQQIFIRKNVCWWWQQKCFKIFLKICLNNYFFANFLQIFFNHLWRNVNAFKPQSCMATFRRNKARNKKLHHSRFYFNATLFSLVLHRSNGRNNVKKDLCQGRSHSHKSRFASHFPQKLNPKTNCVANNECKIIYTNLSTGTMPRYYYALQDFIQASGQMFYAQRMQHQNWRPASLYFYQHDYYLMGKIDFRNMIKADIIINLRLFGVAFNKQKQVVNEINVT